MKNKNASGLLLAACLLALPSPPANAAEQVVSGRASVVDGDTLELHGLRVRLDAIDAPEARQRCHHGGNEWPTILVTRLSALMVVGGFVLFRRIPLPWRGAPWRLLAAMGFCDATALGLVQAAGSLPHAEFAAVTSSTFGVVTILLAWAFLKERLGALQWGSVAVVFAGIGYLAL